MFDVTFIAKPTSIVSYESGFAQLASSTLFSLFDIGGVFSITIYDVNANHPQSLEIYHTVEKLVYDPWYGESHRTINSIYNDFDSFDGDYSYQDYSGMSNSGLASYISSNPIEFLAVWTPSIEVSEVPVPAAAFLFAPALLGFMGFRRKAKNVAA